MHKMKRPCVCGHRAGKHDRDRKKILHMPFRSGKATPPYENQKHTGFCHVEGCNCRAFKERKPINVPTAKEMIAK
jgi:hypothetical protein